MDKTEKLLRICADTLKMPGWRDALSIMTDKYSANELSDELLDDVAGGIAKHDSSVDINGSRYYSPGRQKENE